MSVRILIGDMRERLRDLPDNSVDSCVCDPPYHLTSIVKRFSKAKPRANMHDKHKGDIKAGQYSRLSKGFMGQSWDGGDVAFQPETWAEVLRVLRPGGHLVAFSGTRTYHRMACSIEDAGFEIRDQLAWVYGSGFPKSHDLGDGWGTALKPAWEPIALCRKPLEGTNAANKAKWGVGGLNVDGCRIEADGEIIEQSGEKVDIARGKTHAGYDRPNATMFRTGKPKERAGPANEQGRWPANLIHDGSDEVLQAFPDAPGQLYTVKGTEPSSPFANVYGDMPNRAGSAEPRGDSGSAARFFYCAKATTEERGEGNNHPTVKPVELMRWLTRLVTPKGGLVLDPFMGSGSTALACDAEQFNFIGCELSADYAAIAERRIRDAAGMFADISVEHAPNARAA
jgi:site-specific DNA-methyltransferase (adenine-specific)